jgi:hypothetical protein
MRGWQDSPAIGAERDWSAWSRSAAGCVLTRRAGSGAGDTLPSESARALYHLVGDGRAYSRRLRPLAARLRKELKYPSEDIVWTVLHGIIAEQRYAHMAVTSQVLLKSLLTELSGLTPAQLAYVNNRASVDFVVYKRVTNQALLAIEVHGFAFHENNPDQRTPAALILGWVAWKAAAFGQKQQRAAAFAAGKPRTGTELADPEARRVQGAGERPRPGVISRS